MKTTQYTVKGPYFCMRDSLLTKEQAEQAMQEKAELETQWYKKWHPFFIDVKVTAISDLEPEISSDGWLWRFDTTFTKEVQE